MKTTIREQLEKIHKIDHAILTVERYLPKDYFPGQEPLCDVINLLSEYREIILDGKVDI
jgi:hypothetical protein